jgi:hypothetical protein
MEVRYTYKFRPQSRRVWQWDPARGILLPRRRFAAILASPPPEPTYEWRLTVPVEIVVVRQVYLKTPS